MDKRSNVILIMFFKHFFFLFFKLHSSSSWSRLSEKFDLVLSPFWDGVILKNEIRKMAFIWLHIIWYDTYNRIKSRLTRCHTFNVPLGFIFSHFELRNLKSRNFSNNFHQSSHLFSSACPTKFNKQGIKVNTSSCSSYQLTI